jgi:hypothetical protein
MYISYNIFLCLPYRELDLDHAAGEVCSQDLPYLAITSSAQTTWRASGDLPTSRLGASTANHVAYLL